MENFIFCAVKCCKKTKKSFSNKIKIWIKIQKEPFQLNHDLYKSSVVPK